MFGHKHDYVVTAARSTGDQDARRSIWEDADGHPNRLMHPKGRLRLWYLRCVRCGHRLYQIEDTDEDSNYQGIGGGSI